MQLLLVSRRENESRYAMERSIKKKMEGERGHKRGGQEQERNENRPWHLVVKPNKESLPPLFSVYLQENPTSFTIPPFQF